ncbi:TPA: hypothetical protein N3A33_000508 [Salmonella enterica subsp. salamae serovar 28:r:e,n,z15]|nr:hypothetical protein [Salmonella enterica subsp. salamae serovar 28:r:e,n,z15]
MIEINRGIIGSPAMLPEGTATPVPIPAGGFDLATKYPLYSHEADRNLPGHPISASRGYAARGVLWVNPRGEDPGQIFMNELGQMFCRARASFGWSPWWQMAGKPETDSTGTSLMLTCPAVPSAPGDMFAGGTLDPKKPGTWLARGYAAKGEKNLYMRIK